MKKTLLILAVFASIYTAYSENVIIPAPESVIYSEGTLTLKGLGIYTEDQTLFKDLSEIASERLSPATGFAVTSAAADKADIAFLTDSTLPKEGYTLSVGPRGIVSRASGYGGHFYALQTLLQLLPPQICSKTVTNTEWTLPYVTVKDHPRFMWRGMMLDVSRHWFTKQEVKKYIDEISTYKMNVFHWHLTDDQGWRIQIDSYPRLTEVGAWRAQRVGKWWEREPQRPGEPALYGGFYTKDDIREVIEYARKRNITVLPEIDVPGHSLAALVAYPELACLKAPKSVNVGNKFYGIEENSLCVGNDESLKLMDSVLREVAELFPCEYIHIGGDECFKGFWGKCPKCKARMEKEHLTDTKELQSWFIRCIEKIAHSYGKRIIGWNEILEGGLAEDATVMSWQGMKGGITAAKAGHHVIMTPTENCYLDLYQGEPSVEPDTYSMLRLSSCYSFEPVPEGIDPSYILGGQGNLWAESVPTFRHAEYMAWPRGWALSESLWSSGKSWPDFVRRTEEHFKRADEAGINYSGNSMYNAILTVNPDSTITLRSEIDDVVMHYTFDNTIPDFTTPRYTKPLSIPKDATWLKVQSYRNNKKVGNLLVFTIKDLLSKKK